MPETDALTRDHIELEDTRVTRRYFAKFQAITGHMARVAGPASDAAATAGAEGVGCGG